MAGICLLTTDANAAFEPGAVDALDVSLFPPDADLVAVARRLGWGTEPERLILAGLGPAILDQASQAIASALSRSPRTPVEFVVVPGSEAALSMTESAGRMTLTFTVLPH